MFVDRTRLIARNPPALHYGVAVADLRGDGSFDVVVCGFGGPNRVLRWNGVGLVDAAPALIADPDRQAIGLAAGDIDGDGREELYVLNSDTFAGAKRQGDRLFDGFSDGTWVDLFDFAVNASAVNLLSGRSVCAIDRSGRGRCSMVVASYGGPLRCIELDDDGRLHDVASQVGLDHVAGGRSLLAGPIVTPGIDLFVGNENGPNLVFANRGGRFEEVASDLGLADPDTHARGIAFLDADHGFDVVTGSWEGPHRWWRRTAGTAGYLDAAPPSMAWPSRVRTVIVADFDNDGVEEVFFNNIGEPNRLFARRGGEMVEIAIGAAAEPTLLGTGAAVADVDGDGRLELIVAHGESAPQPLAVYAASDEAVSGNHWLRVAPRTSAGAPARGAVVVVHTPERVHKRVVDGGSGYLCQMEPVAHVGLGPDARIDLVEVTWPDGATRSVPGVRADQMIQFTHP